MKAGLFTMLIFSVVFSIFACMREENPQGRKTPGADAQQYTQSASVTLTPQEAHVAEAYPAKAGAEKADPKTLYTQTCGACHQATGKGLPGAFPPLDGSPYVTSDNVERLASIMLYGLSGPIKVLGVEYNSAMTPQGGLLRDEELAAIATYIRSSWSNKASPVDAKVFAEMRKKWGARGMFNIQELGEEK